MLASLTRSNPSPGPDRLASIRSRLVLGLLLPYVCLMGVCAIALFAGPADTNRLPALVVIVGAAVLLPAAMARIARRLLADVEALETERATLAAGHVGQDAPAAAAADVTVAEPSVAELSETVEGPIIEAEGNDANEVVSEDEHPVTGGRTLEIDEDAPIAAAVAAPAQADPTLADDEPAATREPDAVDEEAPIAAATMADDEAAAASEPDRVDEEAPIAAATAPVNEWVGSSSPATFDLDALLAAAVAARQRTAELVTEAAAPEAEAGGEPEAEADIEPVAAARPMLTPSTIGRQILTGAAAEPAA